MKFVLFFRLLLLLTCISLIACGRHPASAPRTAASPTPATQTTSGPPGTLKPGLPDFAVQPVRTQEGIAEWYDVPGQSLAARRAWPAELTAASDTLPQNTYVRVTSLSPEKGRGDGQPVVVRITDNGVHKPGVLIDLDRDAARALGIVKAGEAKVRVEILTLRNADADKPVDKKNAPTVPRISELTSTPAVGEKAEKDAARAKTGGTP